MNLKELTDEEKQQVERHPIPPFFPRDAQMLFLGSFPPPKKRWCMNFFYPNLQNDFWRIFGLVFFQDRDFFLTPPEKGEKRIFDRERIMEFLRSRKIAMYDTAAAVIREKGNASDAALRIVESLDLNSVLKRDLPECRVLLATGEKAVNEILKNVKDLNDTQKPAVGGCVTLTLADREITLCRLPSSSRAYPLALEKKAEIYGKMFHLLLSHDKIRTE